jgi:hypothetical protein
VTDEDEDDSYATNGLSIDASLGLGFGLLQERGGSDPPMEQSAVLSAVSFVAKRS